MLETLNRIDWKALGEPWIPNWLKGATSVDRSIWLPACQNLSGRLTPWPAFDEGYGTPDTFKRPLWNDIPQLTVPFLIELLADELVAMDAREIIFEMLHNLACYVYAAEAYTNSSNPEDRIYRTRAKIIREKVRQGLPIYEDLLKSKYSILQQGAKDILRILQNDPNDL